jgi:hypothetical protein
VGLNLLSQLISSELSSNTQSTHVLATVTVAYQQGKITKAQYFAVINALDEASTTSSNYQIKIY